MYQLSRLLLAPDPQEKLQKCLEPLEQKLQEITCCKASEEKKPGELKVKLGCPFPFSSSDSQGKAACLSQCYLVSLASKHWRDSTFSE